MNTGIKRLLIVIFGLLFAFFGVFANGLLGTIIAIIVYVGIIYCIKWIIAGFNENKKE